MAERKLPGLGGRYSSTGNQVNLGGGGGGGASLNRSVAKPSTYFIRIKDGGHIIKYNNKRDAQYAASKLNGKLIENPTKAQIAKALSSAAVVEELTKQDNVKSRNGSSSDPLRVKITESTMPPPKPRARPTDSAPKPRARPKSDASSGAKLKDNLSMSKDKMANSIAAARKRGEGYYFDKKAGEKRLAVYKSDMKEGESLRTTANRLLGKTKRKK